MIQRGFTFNFTPLTVSHGIALVGTVPDEQNYSSYEKAYTPDYEVTPLSLMPWIDIIDKDGVLESGRVNEQISTFTWTEVIDRKSSVITNDSEGYSIVTTGEERGKLMMSKNITPDTTITLKFYAELIDTRTKQTFVIQDSYLLSCYSASSSTPVLELSIADSSLYNPLKDEAKQVIEASLYVGNSGLISSDKASFVWKLSNDLTTYHTAGDDLLDYWATAEGNKLTIDKSLMGNVVKVRCYALYGEDEISDSTPSKTVTITRRIPKYEASIEGCAARLAATQETVDLSLYVSDKDGKIDGYEKELLPLWYLGDSDSSGDVDLNTMVGAEPGVKVDVSSISKDYGGVIGADLKDRGGWRALASDGKVITDSNGKIIVIH
jgi:hypothetical protein